MYATYEWMGFILKKKSRNKTMSTRYQTVQDPDVRQPLPPNYGYYQEQLFMQPDKRLTTLNSDNNCGHVELIDPNNELKRYSNAALTGSAHPRTRIAPIIPARSTDIEYWRDSPMTTLSIINSRKKQYPTLAGYNTEELTDLQCLQPDLRLSLGNQTWASPLVQTIQPGVYTLPTAYDPINTDFNIDEATQFEPIRQDRPVGNVVFRPEDPSVPPNQESEKAAPTVEAYEPIKSSSKKKAPKPTPNPPTKPKRRSVSPEPAGSRSASTSPARPSDFNTRQAGLSGYQHPLVEDDVSVYNVFDPRFSGYGSDNRNYLEPMLRQPRYFYDDVDAIRRPNYIVRSKLDSCVTVFGDQYGPMRTDQKTLNQLRPLAEQAYLNNNLNYRNDLMESLMRKKNSEKWQDRAAPKYTTRQSLK
jgi:hypothetical protein